MSSDSRDTRTRILDATFLLLEKGGHGTVRMSDIARAAGVSRQAVYLHFDGRAELLTAALRHRDAESGVEARLEPSRSAKTGIDRLRAFIAFWAGHVPGIHAVARALLAMRDTDPAAAAAWDERMAAVREGCAAVTEALARDGALADGWTVETATDLMWASLSVQLWDVLTKDCGWSEADYVARMQKHLESTLVRAVAKSHE